MWGFFTIYGNYEPKLLFAYGPKWKNGISIRGQRGIKNTDITSNEK